jgi:hypothetical protein
LRLLLASMEIRQNQIKSGGEAHLPFPALADNIECKLDGFDFFIEVFVHIHFEHLVSILVP